MSFRCFLVFLYPPRKKTSKTFLRISHGPWRRQDGQASDPHLQIARKRPEENAKSLKTTCFFGKEKDGKGRKGTKVKKFSRVFWTKIKQKFEKCNKKRITDSISQAPSAHHTPEKETAQRLNLKRSKKVKEEQRSTAGMHILQMPKQTNSTYNFIRPLMKATGMSCEPCHYGLQPDLLNLS